MKKGIHSNWLFLIIQSQYFTLHVFEIIRIFYFCHHHKNKIMNNVINNLNQRYV